MTASIRLYMKWWVWHTISNYCTLPSLQMLSKVPWYNARTSISQISLGSLMVIIVINAMQINIAQMRVSIIWNTVVMSVLSWWQDKYLHTNCLAALANMSSRFHSLHLQAAQKIIRLYLVTVCVCFCHSLCH